MNRYLRIIKKIQLLLIFSILVSCSKDDPSMVAEKFIIAVNNGEYETARDLSTQETGKLIDLLESLEAVSTESVMENETPAVVIEDVSTEGNRAIVRFRTGNDSESLEMRKVDGRWLAHVSKEDINDKELLNDDSEFEYNEYFDESDSSLVEGDSPYLQ